MLKCRLGIFCFIIIFMFCKVPAGATLIEDKEEYVIVIDPGHGGKDTGSTSNENYDEKEITLKTALALTEELSKYEDITVYMTHEKDVALTLEQRAKYAQKKDADFLISIHFNATDNHNAYGSEVWIPLEAPFHALGYQFAYMHQLQMKNMGLFVRGIKTRVGENGTDYYGIIRECVSRDIPAVIIEHCYIDEKRDSSFCESDEDFAELGRRNALAIAQFLGLEEYNGPKELLQLSIEDTIPDTYQDESAPDLCDISIEKYDPEALILTLKVSAADAESALMYYDYSLDGGITYSKLFTWPGCDMLTGEYDNSFSFLIEKEKNIDFDIIFRAYNKFGLSTESNLLNTQISIQEMVASSQPDDFKIVEVDKISDDAEASHAAQNTEVILKNNAYLLWIMAILTVLVVLIPILYYIYSKKQLKEDAE